MKRLAVLLAVAAAACSSNKVNIIRPEIGLTQIVGPADVGYPQGQMDVQYGMRVANRAGDAITLKRVEIQSVGSGAYVLRHDNFYFNERIDPEHYADVTFWVHAYARGGPFGHGTSEPVTVRGIAYFESPAGPFQQIFQRDLSQFSGRGD